MKQGGGGGGGGDTIENMAGNYYNNVEPRNILYGRWNS